MLANAAHTDACMQRACGRRVAAAVVLAGGDPAHVVLLDSQRRLFVVRVLCGGQTGTTHVHTKSAGLPLFGADFGIHSAVSIVRCCTS